MTSANHDTKARPEAMPTLSAPGAINRRTVMNMFVGSAAVVGASIIPETAPADTKPLNVDAARPELRDAIRALEDAHDALKAADDTHKIAWDLWRDWERKNPRPELRRAYRKWERRSEKFCDQIGLDAARDALDAALVNYRDAQQRLGQLRAVDRTELALKAGASVAWEGAILEKTRRHLRGEQQLVAWSVAMDALLLYQGVAG